MPGPFEMIILAGMGLVLFVGLVVVLIAVMRTRAENRDDDQLIDPTANWPKCPECGNALAPGVAACAKCGQANSA